MTTGSRQWVLLGILLLVLGGVVAYQLRGPEPTATRTASSNRAAARQGGSAARAEVTDVQLERLSAEATPFQAPRRDPFRFRARVQAPVAKPPEPPPPIISGPPPPPPPPPRPPISQSLRLIGIIQTDQQRVAVLHDGTQNPPIHGVAGDIIEGRYRLLRVDENGVEMTYLDGGPPQRIPLPRP